MSESLFDEANEVLNRIEDNLQSVNERLYTKQNLFDRAVNLYQAIATAKEDIKALKEDFTYDEDMNPKGMDKDEVKETVAFAAKYVAAGVEKVIETAEMYKSLKEELVGE